MSTAAAETFEVPATTTAMVWQGNADDGTPVFELTDLPLAVTDADAVVAVELATVCGSDRHTASGRRPAPCPSVLGHEAVGRLVRVPAGRRSVTGAELQVGDRVIWSVTESCSGTEVCDRCRAGITAKCRHLRKAGHEAVHGSWPLSGGYAGHVVLPPGLAIATVPEEVADGPAATAACALATVMACLESATAVGGVTGRRVLIFGAGMLGLYAAAVAATEGAAQVTVIDPEPVRRELAGRFGATQTAADGDGRSADVVIELSGAPGSVAAGLAALEIGGTLVLAGSVLPGGTVDLDPEQVVRRWVTIRGVHNYEPRHLGQAVRFLAEHDWPWHRVIGEPRPLTDPPALLGARGNTGRPEMLRESVRPGTRTVIDR